MNRMANAARKRLEPLESLKYQRRMGVYRRLRGITLSLFVLGIVVGVMWLLSHRPDRPTFVSVSQPIMVWSRNGVVDAAIIQSSAAQTQLPHPARRSLATVVLVANQPRASLNWLERQVGERLFVRSSLTLASLDPTPGYEPLNDEDRVHLARVIEREMVHYHPSGSAQMPALNSSCLRLYLRPICGPILTVVIAMTVASAACAWGYGLIVNFLEGLRSGISPRACPSCDYDLSAIAAAPDPEPSAATAAAPDDGRVYRQCPECGWKGHA